MDEIELRRIVNVAHRAQVRLDDQELWRDIDTIRESIFHKIEMLPDSAEEDLRTLKMQLTALRCLRENLKTDVNNGKRAQSQLEELRQNGPGRTRTGTKRTR